MPSAPPPRVVRELAVRVAVAAVAVVVLPYIFVGDVAWFWENGQALAWDRLPYRGLDWEFPPTTVLWLLPARYLPSGAYLVVFMASMVAAEYGSLRLLRRAWPDDARAITRAWNLTALPLATVAYFRFDFLAVLGAVGALTAIRRGRSGSAWMALGVGAKLWPALVAVVHLVERRWSALAANVVAVVALVGAWWAWSPAGMDRWMAYRRGSGLQVESLAASLVRPFTSSDVELVSGTWVIGAGGWAWVEAVSSLVLVAVGVVLVVRALRRPGADAEALVGALVTLVVLCSRLLSPQYLVWLVPVVALSAARGRRRPTVLLAGAGAATVVLLDRYASLALGELAGQALLLVRNGLLVWLLVDLIRAVRSADVPANVRSAGLPPTDRLPSWPTSSSSAEPVSTT